MNVICAIGSVGSMTVEQMIIILWPAQHCFSEAHGPYGWSLASERSR